MSISSSRRFSALLATTAVAALAMLGMAQPASAAPSPALPDGSKTANLHITKLDAPATTTQGNGTQQPVPAGKNPIGGVTFTVKRVNTIDLTTQAGWDSAGTLSGIYNGAAATSPAAAEAAVTGAGFTLGAGASQVTAADGTADFSALPLGLYLVEETGVPAGVTPSAPFLVTLPMTNPTNHNQWMYDVYVYPKNAKTNIVKSVTDAQAAGLGDKVTWHVQGDIPAASGPTDKVSGYVITDRLDKRLTYTAAPGATATLSDGTALVKGTDYTVAFDAATNTVEVRFTAAGLDILTAHRDAKVLVDIPTVANATGVIPNTAVLYPNDAAVQSYDTSGGAGGNPGGDTTGGGGTPSNTVETKWGSVKVQKLNPTGGTLAGAAFKVYTSLTDAENDTNAVVINDGVNPPVDTFTTGADGTVNISGLRYSDWANGAPLSPPRDYYLVEVQAPDGYELQADPIKFQVNDSTTNVVDIDIKVTDVPHNGGFELPFTGGTGSSLVYLGAVLLLGGAMVVAFSRRRRATN